MPETKETRAFLNSPTSSEESVNQDLMENSARHGQRNDKSQKGAVSANAENKSSSQMTAVPKAKAGSQQNHVLTVSSSSARSNSNSSKGWQRPSSSRYDVPRMVGSDGGSPSPCPMPAGHYDDHDPGRWHTDRQEPDDYLHDVSKPDRTSVLSGRGLVNIGTLLFLILGIAMLFLGYPILSEFYFAKDGKKGGFGLGGSNGSGQIPDLDKTGFRWNLIDKDTPKSALKKKGFGRNSDETWNLQWSDEFEVQGRSFYPNDDPFWEAVDLYAHGTGDYEWYSPAAVTTKDGALVITCNEQDINDLRFRSGQVTTWNKFCYTGGYLEAAVILPGSPRVSGWWPAIWTMGNLGRANYGATTEGLWPYSYNTCDRGALINQTDPDGLGPPAALRSGGETIYNDRWKTTSISFQPGQRLSACTCDGEDHPGPKNGDGNFIGRAAPELDMFEAQIDGHLGGTLSLSGQFMPANSGYWLNNATGRESEFYEINGRMIELNSYRGNILQQSASGIAITNQESYEATGNVYSIWGFEYEPGDDGYVTWWVDGQKAWTMNAAAVGSDPKTGISQRPIPEEPMYIIMNLAISSGFGYVDWEKLSFPSHMKVDYLRLYQAKGKENVGCDPKSHPTKDYIDRHILAYTNPNFTVWGGTADVGGYEQDWPRNRLYDNGQGCSAAHRKYPGPLRDPGAPPRTSNVASQDDPTIHPDS